MSQGGWEHTGRSRGRSGRDMVEGRWGVEWDGLDSGLHDDRDDSGAGSLLNPARGLRSYTWKVLPPPGGRRKDAPPTSGASPHGTELRMEDFSISPGRTGPLPLPPRLALPCQWGDACQGSE